MKPLKEIAARRDGSGNVEWNVPDRQEHGARRHHMDRSLVLLATSHGDARLCEYDAMAWPECERLRRSALPTVRDTQIRPAAGLHPHVCRDRGRLLRKWIDAGCGTHEQRTGAQVVRRDTVTRAVEDRKEELSDRVRPHRVVSDRPQDPDRVLIVTAQDGADAVLGC
jgi:hypothetical protein